MRRVMLIAAIVCALAGPALQAQFGHPLKGQWSGEWGPKDKPNRLLLNFEWDGKEISGVINPGPSQMKVNKADIDFSNPEAWKVHLTASGKDAAGKDVAVTVDGTLENIGVYYKVFRGTWTQGAQKGDFLVTRN